MAVRTLRRRGGRQDYTWPGFVDVLSSLLLVIIFLLSVFVLAQFFLGQALSGRDAALEELRDQVGELSSLLQLERDANQDMQVNIAQLSASLQTSNVDRDELTARIRTLETDLQDAEARLGRAQTSSADTTNALTALQERFGTQGDELAEEKRMSVAAQAEVERLNSAIAALRNQLSRIEAALLDSEERDRDQKAVIADLGRRLNVALAQRVEELAAYRSEFFGRLREVLGERADIRVEGDRFIFQSELLFSSGSASLGVPGQEEMRKLAQTLLEISATIPADISWILRIDGHTDRVPITTARFPSNWELSTARATSVVKYLVAQGVPPERLAATGFGPYQPLDPADNAAAYRRNRRIEMRFTQR